METTDNFINYLKFKGCYEQFCRNLDRRGNYELEDLSNGRFTNCKDLLNHAFSWEDTPEHDDYWRNLSGEWREVCSNGKVFPGTNCESIW